MNAIMAHMIPFFPDYESSLEVAKALLDEKIDYLEIQFPYSDPSADGPTIEAACQKAILQGFTIQKGFEFIAEVQKYISKDKLKTEVFIMSYASLIIARGVEKFTREAKAIGVRGLIIPDLPLDFDDGLNHACRESGLVNIPVTVPFMSEDRIKMVQKESPSYVYCALRAGITGSETKIDKDTLDFLAKMKKTGARLLGGFGISTKAQIDTLAPHVHAAVVGSALVRVIEKTSNINKEVRSFVQSLR